MCGESVLLRRVGVERDATTVCRNVRVYEVSIHRELMIFMTYVFQSLRTVRAAASVSGMPPVVGRHTHTHTSSTIHSIGQHSYIIMYNMYIPEQLNRDSQVSFQKTEPRGENECSDRWGNTPDSILILLAY